MIECPFCGEMLEEEELVYEFSWGEVATYFYNKGPLSSAPNRMILEGATPVLCHWDILEHYRWAHRPQAEKAQKPRQLDLEPDERAIVTPLREQELSFDELAAATGFSAAKLNSHLTMLELRGIIEKVPGGMYRAY